MTPIESALARNEDRQFLSDGEEIELKLLMMQGKKTVKEHWTGNGWITVNKDGTVSRTQMK